MPERIIAFPEIAAVFIAVLSPEFMISPDKKHRFKIFIFRKFIIKVGKVFITEIGKSFRHISERKEEIHISSAVNIQHFFHHGPADYPIALGVADDHKFSIGRFFREGGKTPFGKRFDFRRTRIKLHHLIIVLRCRLQTFYFDPVDRSFSPDTILTVPDDRTTLIACFFVTDTK